MVNFKKNELLTVDVIDLTHEGQGVVKLDGFPFFVANALPGEQIKMRVLKVGKNFGFGRVEEFLKLSEQRVTDLNTDYLRTGIADLGHLAYEQQLIYKRQQVVELLHKTAHKTDFPVAQTLASPQQVAYRNKAQVPVREVNGLLTTGFFRKNSHDLIAVEDFYIQAPEIDELVLWLRDACRQIGLTAYDEQTRRGWLRNLVIRRGFHSGEMMLVFVVSSAKLPVKFDRLLSDLTEKFDKLCSVQLNVNRSEGSFILGKEFHVLAGREFIKDQMLGKSFEISAPAFYQVNTAQAERMYQLAYDFAELKKTDIIVDAYSGIGTIGLGVAEQVAAVYGMEVVAAAVKNSKRNAALNGLDNTHYETGTAEEIFPKWLKAGVKPDVIFVDPPRKGLEESFIAAATATSARSLIYISCNPATFARDVTRIEARGYRLDKVQPVDLFPQTHHVEVVAKFDSVKFDRK